VLGGRIFPALKRRKALKTGILASRLQKNAVNHSFSRFFSLQGVLLSRMIGLTKKELKHFSVVLFCEPLARASECGDFF
jgi:hypothetical protein